VCSLYLGVVLAAGRSRRMGRDKALIEFGGARLVDYVSRRLLLQLDDVIINMRCDEADVVDLPCPVIGDVAPFAGLGPLSGLYAAFCYMKETAKHYDAVITIAVDTPFFPNNYVARLSEIAALYPQRTLIATSAGKVHPTFSLWPLAVEQALAAHLQQGDYAILSFAKRVGAEFVDFPPKGPGEGDAFFNINGPQDLQLAQQILKYEEGR